jgi:hypothetical protein
MALPLYAYQTVIFDSLKFEKNKIGKTGGKLSEDSVAYLVSSVLVESATIELCSHIKPHVTIFTLSGIPETIFDTSESPSIKTSIFSTGEYASSVEI